MRLCVETLSPTVQFGLLSYAAAFVRLCVETVTGGDGNERDKGSRLRAAVC